MSGQKKYRLKKFVRISLTLLLIAGGVILTVSAVRNDKKENSISGIKMRLTGSGDNHALSEQEILSMLKTMSKGEITRQPADSVDLLFIENELNKNKWIRKAQVYVDSRGVLRVDVEENKPVARVFVSGGTSFYLSDHLDVMPVRPVGGVSVPMFTGYTGNMSSLRKSDSILFSGIAQLSDYINTHPFWMAQIDQVNIVGAENFDLVPKLGNQVIHFGSADSCDEKFDKLMAFYKQVMVRTGWSRYSAIDLRFSGQVVAEKRDAQKIYPDSLAAVRIMKQMVQEAKKKESDTRSIQLPVQKADPDDQPVAVPDEADDTVTEDVTGAKQIGEEESGKKESEKASTGQKTPKAVLSPKRN